MRTRLSLMSALASGTSILLLATLATGQQGKTSVAPTQPAKAVPARPAQAVPTQPAAAAPAQPAQRPMGAAEPIPQAGQTFVGVMKCASCHFDKYADWKKQQEKHAKAFDILPAKYQQDASCLVCHTTGFGRPSGYRTAADRQLAGITCESCHGPGSIHAEISKPFANKKGLAPEQVKPAHDSIYLMLPENVCVTCHATRAHKLHPEYEKP